MAKEVGVRFAGPADVLDLRQLHRGNRKFLYVGLLLALFVHAGVAAYFMLSKKEARVPKPPTMELVVRKPRMTKAFEFRKKRVPKRVMTRKVVSAKPVVTQTITKRITGANLFGTIITFDYFVDSGASMGIEVVQPEIASAKIATSKDPEKRISMEEEFIDLDALDTGKYKGLVIQDPTDKQNIKGFVYLARAKGNTLYPAVPSAIPELVKAINEFTRIQAKVEEDLYLDSRDLFKTPFVYLTAKEAFEATKKEVENLGEYLRAGGFVFVDNIYPKEEYSPSEASLRKLIKDALGRDARFQTIPNNHPIYHSFFDFDGPPVGSEVDAYKSGTGFTEPVELVHYLEGVFLKGRLAVLYSDKGYGINWQKMMDNEVQLRMGVNLVVFALTQKGSIAQQQIDFYSQAR